MKKFTYKEFMNGEFSILVSEDTIKRTLEKLSRTGLIWRFKQNLNEFNPYVTLVSHVSIRLFVESGLLSWSCNLLCETPLVSIESLVIEPDDIKSYSFIGQCIKSNDKRLCSVGKLYYFKDGITTLNDGRSSLEYSSIEDFNKRNDGIEMVEIKEVKRKAKVGEYVKVVKPYEIPKTNGTLDYDVGSILKIINIDEDGNCHYSDRCNGYLYDEEYVVLEGYKDFTEDKIEVGDMVEVTDSDRCFTTYPEWFKETGNLEYKNHFVQYRFPTKNKQYKVVCKGKHYFADVYPEGVYCIQDLDTTQVFLMCKDGIKK